MAEPGKTALLVDSMSTTACPRQPQTLRLDTTCRTTPPSVDDTSITHHAYTAVRDLHCYSSILTASAPSSLLLLHPYCYCSILTATA